MTVPHTFGDWRKSSYSANTDNCVEVRFQPLAGVEVRDAKHQVGGCIAVNDDQWRAFVQYVKK